MEDSVHKSTVITVLRRGRSTVITGVCPWAGSTGHKPRSPAWHGIRINRQRTVLCRRFSRVRTWAYAVSGKNNWSLRNWAPEKDFCDYTLRTFR